jgi:hypothetical protein
MDDVLYGEAKELPKVEGQTQVAEQVEAETLTQADAAEADPSAPTAQANTEKHVPLAALEAERQGRKDWKEKALRLEGEMKVYRDREQRDQAHQQNPQDQAPIDPIQRMQEQLINERLNTSEMLARAKYPDMDEKLALFEDACKQNPALGLAINSQRHPWEYVYKEGERLALQKEIGTDPASYRERIKAELLKEMQEAVPVQASATAPVRLPQSLAGARSTAARSAPAFTGPTPFDQILN